MNEIITKQKFERTLKILNNGTVISSVEIAKVFRIPHNDIFKKVRELIKRGDIIDYKETTYINSRDRVYDCYLIFNGDINK